MTTPSVKEKDVCFAIVDQAAQIVNGFYGVANGTDDESTVRTAYQNAQKDLIALEAKRGSSCNGGMANNCNINSTPLGALAILHKDFRNWQIKHSFSDYLAAFVYEESGGDPIRKEAWKNAGLSCPNKVKSSSDTGTVAVGAGLVVTGANAILFKVSGAATTVSAALRGALALSAAALVGVAIGSYVNYLIDASEDFEPQCVDK